MSSKAWSVVWIGSVVAITGVATGIEVYGMIHHNFVCLLVPLVLLVFGLWLNNFGCEMCKKALRREYESRWLEELSRRRQ